MLTNVWTYYYTRSFDWAMVDTMIKIGLICLLFSGVLYIGEGLIETFNNKHNKNN